MMNQKWMQWGVMSASICLLAAWAMTEIRDQPAEESTPLVADAADYQRPENQRLEEQRQQERVDQQRQQQQRLDQQKQQQRQEDQRRRNTGK